MNNEEITMLDLFSGIGGFSYAAHLANRGSTGPVFRTSAFVERDKFCQRVLRKHWPEVPIFDDDTTLDADGLGTIDLVTGGFPCQPWSVAGEQRGAEDDRDLWPEMVALVEKLRPRFLIGENVRGFVNETLGLQRSLSDLESIGYEAVPFIIPACSKNAPHRRDRVFILGYTQHYGWSSSEERGRLFNKPEKQERQKEIGGFTGAGCASHNVAHSRCSLQSGRKLRKEDENETREWDADQPKRSSSPSEFNVADTPQLQRDGSGRVGEGKPRSEFRRMADGVSRRLDEAGLHPGWENGEPEGMQRVSVGTKDRALRLKALGNSIVPQVAEQLFRAILEGWEK